MCRRSGTVILHVQSCSQRRPDVRLDGIDHFEFHRAKPLDCHPLSHHAQTADRPIAPEPLGAESIAGSIGSGRITGRAVGQQPPTDDIVATTPRTATRSRDGGGVGRFERRLARKLWKKTLSAREKLLGIGFPFPTEFSVPTFR